MMAHNVRHQLLLQHYVHSLQGHNDLHRLFYKILHEQLHHLAAALCLND
jgi:hypothetical protein